MSATPWQMPLLERPPMAPVTSAEVMSLKVNTARATLEQTAAEQVEATRSLMAEVRDSAPASDDPQHANLLKRPTLWLWQGKLVIVGTTVADTVKVEELAGKYDADLQVTGPLEYLIEVNYTLGGKPASLTWHVPIEQVPTKSIFFFGEKGNDDFSFAPAPFSQTRIFADGGAGADTLSGGQQADFLDGGLAYSEKDTLSGQGGHDILAGGGGADAISGDAGDDLLWGESGADALLGDDGIDHLFGGAENDNLAGGLAHDHIFGGLGKDTLSGDEGDDYLCGGEDTVSDSLTGGEGYDAFAIAVVTKAAARDVLTDVEPNVLRATDVGFDVTLENPPRLMPVSAELRPSLSNFGMFGASTLPFGGGNNAALFQMMATDMQQIQTIFTQVAADADKQRADRWRIMSDTQTKIFEITQDVTVNKAKTADKAFSAMNAYIHG